MRKLNDVAIGGAVTTVVALLCRLVFAKCNMTYVEAWGQYCVYVLLGGCIVIGLVLMTPNLTNPIRLVGHGFFGAGVGGLFMNLLVDFCATHNQSDATILFCEILATIVLFLFSGLQYSRKSKKW